MRPLTRADAAGPEACPAEQGFVHHSKDRSETWIYATRRLDVVLAQCTVKADERVHDGYDETSSNRIVLWGDHASDYVRTFEHPLNG